MFTPNEFDRIVAEADCLYTREQVEMAIRSMAKSISRDLSDKNIIVLCVMTGGLIPAGQLLTELKFPLEIDYIHATRYRRQTTGGILDWRTRPSLSLQDRTVLIVDDILDEGITLREIVAFCKAEGASEVLSAVLTVKQLDKPHAIEANYVGLALPNRYVFGCGMDYKGYFRNLPGIYAVNES